MPQGITKEVVLPARKGTEKEGDIQKKLSHIFSCAMLKLTERVSVVFRFSEKGCKTTSQAIIRRQNTADFAGRSTELPLHPAQILDMLLYEHRPVKAFSLREDMKQ